MRFPFAAMVLRVVPLLTVTLLLTNAAYGTDFTEWLGRRGWKVVEKTSTDGEYLIEDVTGRVFRLRRSDPADMLLELSVAKLSKALGVTSVPVFPALAQVSGETLGPVTENAPPESIVAVLVRPEVKESALGAKLNNAQLVELATSLLVKYFVANTETTNFALVNGHVVARPTNAVYEPPGGSLALAAVFAAFPAADFKAGSWADRNRVLTALNQVLSRMEILDRDIDGWAGIFNAALNAHEGTKGRLDSLVKRVRGARAELAAYFTALVPAEGPQLLKPEAVSAPIVRLPPLLHSATDQTPTLDLLWNLWERAETLTVVKSTAALAARKFPEGTKAASAPKALARLMDGTRTDMSRIYLVLPHRLPKPSERRKDLVAQVTLAPGNEDTLIVVPLNDPEAEMIAEFAEEAGARVLALSKYRYGHGAKLDQELHDAILAEYKRKPFKRVGVVELPGKPIELESALRADPRFIFFPIDHHDYGSEQIFRHQAYGSAEQAADLLGFEMSPTDMFLALYDRSFVFGALEAGFDREFLRDLVGPVPKSLEALGDGIASSAGPIYLLGAFDGKIGDAASAIAVRDYPRVNTIFLVEPGQIRFSGSPTIERRLTAVFQTLNIPGAKLYSFGDVNRSRGWGLKEIPRAEEPRALAALRQVLQEFSGEAGAEGLAIALGQSLDQGEMTVDQRVRVSDGPRRSATLRGVDWAALSNGDRDRFVAIAQAALAQEADPAALTALLGDGLTIPNYTSFDFGAFIAVATASKDRRWIPYLQACLSAWQLRFKSWHGPLAAEAQAALDAMPPAPADGAANCGAEIVK